MGERTTDLPLGGINVLVTRAAGQSKGLVSDLTSRGADVTVIPTVSFHPIAEPEGFGQAIADVQRYESMIFTSVNGVKSALLLIEKEGMEPRLLPPALCVGEKTARAWEEAGGTVAAVPEQFTAEALLDSLDTDLAGRIFLLVRPEVVKTELGAAMRERGATVDEIILYRTVAPGEGGEALKGMMAEGGPDVILFASPSAVEGILKIADQSPKPKAQGENETQSPEPGLLEIPVICIGPTTAKAAEQAGFTEIYFPDLHTAEGMVEELMVISARLANKGAERGAQGAEGDQ